MAATTERKDPLVTFLFTIEIPLVIDGETKQLDRSTAFFKSVGGLKRETEVEDYVEGGVNTFTRKVIKVTKWPNLVLKQGFTGDNTLWAWRENPGQRVDGSIVMLGPNMEEKARWRFKRGYPVKWEGPELDASKNELAIETIEIVHEGLELV
jgi:phage tail-like protein